MNVFLIIVDNTILLASDLTRGTYPSHSASLNHSENACEFLEFVKRSIHKDKFTHPDSYRFKTRSHGGILKHTRLFTYLTAYI